MKLSSIILKIAEKMDGQRTLNACLHILRGKRSGQTLQDVDAFSVKPYFAILPKLSEAAFAESADFLQKQRLLGTEGGLIRLSPEGKRAAEELPEFRFDGWHFRGRENVFFQRLQLLVQTCSQLRSGNTSFLPITNDRAVQQFVKGVVRNSRMTGRDLAEQLARELAEAVRASGMSDVQAVIFSHRLTGYGAAGWTWDQIEEAAGEPRNSLQLDWLEGLHRFTTAAAAPSAREDLPLLHGLSDGIRMETPLTDSTSITKRLFDQGLTVEEIAHARQLKTSTIEDHLTELAANTAAFPISRFVSAEDQHAVRMEVSLKNVKRLRLLKEAFPHLSYFQLRLVLSAREEVMPSEPS
ncbi:MULTISPECIES: helix-turn-helix domain-containing protein [Sporosarcina]|uniref:helix-turn-helix domain-containing protein n=1 Tax=Sporosarcina TaxID=1569 RepID=UPI0005911308|nr:MULTISPECIES: helix-turn-helix domain-containing protein [Sporosarcina]WJY28616.1 helix-turn-helix domain-containing protein [Sporosarcina sp. 0.2-SM1T-5]